MKHPKKEQYQKGLSLIRQRVLQDPAVTTPQERQEALAGRSSAVTLAAYLQKVQDAAYQVTDEEVQALVAEKSDDALYELTIAAALGAATKRLEAGLRVIDSLEE